MKIATIIVRVLIGLLFLFASITFLFHLFPQPEQEGRVKLFFEGMQASGYFFQLLKITELVCGIAFVTGRYVALALVVIAPIVVNILMVHIFLDSSGLPLAIPLFAGTLFLAYSYRKNYESLFIAK